MIPRKNFLSSQILKSLSRELPIWPKIGIFLLVLLPFQISFAQQAGNAEASALPTILAANEQKIKEQAGRKIEVVGVPSARSNLIRKDTHFLLFEGTEFYAWAKEADVKRIAPAGLARTYRGKPISIFGAPKITNGRPNIQLTKAGQIRMTEMERITALDRGIAGP